MASHETVREQLNALRQAYAEQLPGKIREIEDAWKRLEREPWDPKGFLVFHRQVHALAGSGATFGFPGVSEKAHGLDDLLKTLPGDKGPPEPEIVARIFEGLGGLKEAAATSPVVAPVLTPPQTTGRDDHLVFLVSRDAAFAESLTAQLGHFGYAVRSFPDTAVLGGAVDREHPGALIADLPTPPQDKEILEGVAELQRVPGRRMPVVFTASRDDLATRFSAVRAGGSGYFPRPLDISSLIDQLELLTSHYSQEPYRILIVDDEVATADRLKVVVEDAGMAGRVVTDPRQISGPLVEFHPDLILMDIYMPGCNGLELAAVIRQQEAFVGIPIVFLSSETDIGRQLGALRLGGDDFLTKPIAEDRLVASLMARAQRARILRSFMVRDSLTGVLNHSRTKAQLQIEVARARRQGRRLAYAMIDIDNFKDVNDRHGHPAGDRVILSLSRLLQNRLRKTDIIGRYGGDEFAVILPDADGPTALRILAEICGGFSHIRHASERGEFSATFSGGVAILTEAGDAGKLNEAADRALYEAKAQGRNRVVLAE
ncbi:MAG TPA: diguanylate cyclase [Planctomycetota bacterium]|jgi:diguanylate cyclase (GGDEF)-like protein